MAWFWHFRDHISVKNPDEAILAKMYKIATSLNAKVQGDEGEIYGPDGKPEGTDASSSASRQKPWWKFWE